jgi:hypothetical protein
MLKIAKILILALVAVISHNLKADGQKYVVSDLRDQWLIYDEKQETYVPFLENTLEGRHSISFAINLNTNKNYSLHINSPANTSILFNQQLIAHSSINKAHHYNIDSLNKIYKGNLLITLYNPDFKDESHLFTAIVSQGDNTLANHTSGLKDQIQFARRNNSGFSDFFVTGIIVLLFFYAVLINVFGKKIINFYDIGRALSFTIREEMAFKGKIFDGANIPILVVHSFLVSFVGIIIFIASGINYFTIDSFFSALLFWAISTVAIFILYIFKYWLLVLVGSLFKLPFINRHYLEYIRLSKIFFTLILFLLMIFYLGLGQEINNIGSLMVGAVVSFFAIRVILLYFKFIQSSSFNNLYLFSYLCSTEILPMVVGLKILLSK